MQYFIDNGMYDDKKSIATISNYSEIIETHLIKFIINNDTTYSIFNIHNIENTQILKYVEKLNELNLIKDVNFSIFFGVNDYIDFIIKNKYEYRISYKIKTNKFINVKLLAKIINNISNLKSFHFSTNCIDFCKYFQNIHAKILHLNIQSDKIQITKFQFKNISAVTTYDLHLEYYNPLSILFDIIPNLNKISFGEIDFLKQDILMNLESLEICLPFNYEFDDDEYNLLLSTLKTLKNYPKIVNLILSFSEIDKICIENIVKFIKKNKTITYLKINDFDCICPNQRDCNCAQKLDVQIYYALLQQNTIIKFTTNYYLHINDYSKLTNIMCKINYSFDDHAQLFYYIEKYGYSFFENNYNKVIILDTMD